MSNGAPLALLPTWPISCDSGFCGQHVCGSVFTLEGQAGTGEYVPPTALFLALDLYLFSALSGICSLGAWIPFRRSSAVIPVVMSESTYTCLRKALSSQGPRTRFSGARWENVSHKKHKSYCLSTCVSTPQPERGQALWSKNKQQPPVQNVTHAALEWIQAQKYIGNS